MSTTIVEAQDKAGKKLAMIALKISHRRVIIFEKSGRFSLGRESMERIRLVG